LDWVWRAGRVLVGGRNELPGCQSPHAGHRFPAEIIGQAVWLYFRFPLSLRMVEEMLAARGIVVSHETVRRWALKFGREFANRIRRSLPRVGDKWHLDEVAGIVNLNRERSRLRNCLS
jgi:putative transposase